MNNDGDDIQRSKYPDRASFLSQRFSGLEDSEVDSVFYCDGVVNLYSHPSNISETVSDVMVQKFLAKGLVALQMAIDFCRLHHKEIFWSMRMNDTHDVTYPNHMSAWKWSHPEWIMHPELKKFTPYGKLEPESKEYPPYGGHRWTALNYECPEVRERVLDILSEVCSSYDIDGIELDFFRHPVFFKPQMSGGEVTRDHCNMMSDMLRKVRKMSAATGQRRARPISIAVRVPDSIGYAKAMGLDVVQWMEENLIDILVTGGYFHLEPWETTVALGKKYNIPVYPCLSGSRLIDPAYPELPAKAELFRGEALDAWEAGASGIYTFNRFNPRDPLFRELGNPELLKNLSHAQTTMTGEDIAAMWLKDGKRFLKLQNRPVNSNSCR